MINKVNFSTPQYQQSPTFKGAKEMAQIAERVTKLKLRPHDIDTFTSELHNEVKKGQISIDDIKGAAKQMKEPWKKIITDFADALLQR